MRRRDWVGFTLTMLATGAILVGAVPAKSAVIAPPQAPPATQKVLPIQPNEEVIRDPKAVLPPPPYPHGPLPEDLKQRLKDPRSWA